jgi:hydroxyatrazine ethylaminohydrolase
VALTMINGKTVFRDGLLIGVNERELHRRGEEICTRVLREPCEAFHNLA